MEHPEYTEPEQWPPQWSARSLFRRPRRYTPPAAGRPRPPRVRRRRRKLSPWTTVSLTEVAAHLTPRQAVVWLLNLEAMICLYESITGRALARAERAQVEQTIRAIIARRDGAAP